MGEDLRAVSSLNMTRVPTPRKIWLAWSLILAVVTFFLIFVGNLIYQVIQGIDA